MRTLFVPEQDVELGVSISAAAAAEMLASGGEEDLPSVRAFEEERIRSLYPTCFQKHDPQTCFIPWPREPWSGRS